MTHPGESGVCELRSATGDRCYHHAGHNTPHSWQEDVLCHDCCKYLDEHETCAKCEHFDCDCICEFLRTDWPTHPANPERVDVA